ncbi:MAG: hypothetical protein ABIH24_01460 [Verrucomicrobiota bacterium]
MQIKIKKTGWSCSDELWKIKSALPYPVINGKKINLRPKVYDNMLLVANNALEIRMVFDPSAPVQPVGREIGFAGFRGELHGNNNHANSFLNIRVEIHNKGPEPVLIDRLVFFNIAKKRYPEPENRQAKNRKLLRMLFYNDCMFKDLKQFFDNGSRPYLSGPESASDVRGNTSRLFTAVYDPEDESGLCAAFLPDNGRIFHNYFQLTETALAGVSEIGIRIGPKEKIRVGRLLIYVGDRISSLIRKLPDEFGPKRKSPGLAAKAGWNTWDYYLWHVSADDVRENMNFIRKDKDLRKRIKYIIIDGGWYHAYSEWQANYRFPGGLQKLARMIIKAGFIPGIWTGPFLASKISRVMAEKPELIIKNADGVPVIIDDGFEQTACLDPSHKDTHLYLHALFTRLKSYGFRYFKTDFLLWVPLAVARGGRLANPQMTALEALKSGLQTIRKAIGNDSVMLGCGGFIPEIGTGIYDACRASLDISSYWSNILTIARDMAVKSIFAGKIWENDYDFLIVRSKATSRAKKTNVYKDPKMFVPPQQFQPFTLRTGPVIGNENEIRVWASLIIVSGGSLVLADRLKDLNVKGMKILKKALENANDTAGSPLDLLAAGLPRIWFKNDGNQGLLALFNWTDKKTVLTAEILKKYGIKPRQAYEIWSEKIRPLSAVTIGPRDARLFRINN